MAVTSTAEENLKTVWLDILDWYQRLGVDNKFAQLKPTMLRFCVHSALQVLLVKKYIYIYIYICSVLID